MRQLLELKVQLPISGTPLIKGKRLHAVQSGVSDSLGIHLSCSQLWNHQPEIRQTFRNTPKWYDRAEQPGLLRFTTNEAGC